MRILIIILAAALFVIPAHAESPAEKRWRLRAEILERQLELAQMELREKDGSSAQPASTRDFVNAYGTRFASLETDGMQVASLAQRRSSSVDESPAAAKSDEKKKDSPPPEKTEPPKTPDRDWPEQGKWTPGYQILKPSTRIYFDTGSDDTDEVDIFKDGKLGVSIDFLTLSYDYGVTDELSIGFFAAGGISSTTSEADQSAILMVSAGIAVGVKDMPFSFEAGILQGLSASETLKDNSDTALFVGISLNNPAPKKSLRIKPKKPQL